jgi:hypothetical protein
MATFQFNQEACDACRTFAETTNALFDALRSPSADGDKVTSVQENNPPAPTLGTVLQRPGTD